MSKKIVFLLLLLFVLKPITVVASDNDLLNSSTNVELGVSKNLQTGDVQVNEMVTPLKRNSITETSSYIPATVTPISTRQLVGPDDRKKVTKTTTFPNSAICYIEMKFPGDSATYVGTAWMYGDRVAVTAGHCVYDHSLGGWAEWVRVYPGKNGSKSPFGSYYATTLHTSTNYIKNASSDFDWGLLQFSENIGSKTGYFGAKYGTVKVGQSIIVRGYPSEKKKQMWTMSGTISAVSLRRLGYFIDTTGGQSGAPVYQSKNGNFQCVGIHIEAWIAQNNGRLITKSLFEYINKYR